MKKTVLVYGFISGGVMAALVFITCMIYKRNGFSHGEIVGYTGMLASFAFIYLGMVSYRNKVGGGQVKYGQALLIGVLIAFISSTCYVISWDIVFHTMFPDFMDKYAADALAQLQQKGASAAEIAKKTQELQGYKDMYKNPVTMVLLTYMECFPVGVVISLICAFLVRLKKKARTA